MQQSHALWLRGSGPGAGAREAGSLEGGCGCPDKIAVCERASEAARAAIAGENVVALRKAAAEVREARQSVGYAVKVDKSALKAALAAQASGLAKYTKESAAAYTALFANARRVFDDPKATQLEVNRAVRSLKGGRHGVL